MLANIFTNNSGVDVPKATIVRPITRSEILNLLAMEEAPSIIIEAPLINKIKPATKSRYMSTVRLVETVVAFQCPLKDTYLPFYNCNALLTELI
jgi:hypothetical protein